MFSEKKFQKEFPGEGKVVAEGLTTGGPEATTEIVLFALLSLALTRVNNLFILS